MFPEFTVLPELKVSLELSCASICRISVSSFAIPSSRSWVLRDRADRLSTISSVVVVTKASIAAVRSPLRTPSTPKAKLNQARTFTGVTRRVGRSA